MKILKKRLALLVPAVLLAGATLGSLPAGASAAEWFIGGLPLGGSSQQLSATVTKPIVVSVPAVKFKLECTTASFKKLAIFNKIESSAEAINLENCEVKEPSLCKLEKHEIKTEEIVLESIPGSGGSVTQVKTARHGTIIVVNLPESCGPLSGKKVTLTGKIKTVAPTLQSEKLEQKVEFPGEKTEGLFAEIGTEKFPALIAGELNEKLEGLSKAWSFH